MEAKLSASGFLTALLAKILELFAILLAGGSIAIDNALLLLLGIGALRSASIRVRLATRLADLGLTEFVSPRAGMIGRGGASSDERSRHAKGEQ
jgi:hypothetical protein